MTIPDEAVQAAMVAQEHSFIDGYDADIQMKAAITAALPFLTGVKVKAGRAVCYVSKDGEAISDILDMPSYFIYDSLKDKRESEPAPSPRAQALEEAAQVADARKPLYTELQAKNACAEIASSIRGLSSQPVADGWLPIETAPKDGTSVDLWCNHVLHGSTRAADAKFNGREWLIGYCSERLNPDWIPTHWRPLPASPGASE